MNKFMDLQRSLEITLFEYALSVELIHRHHHKIHLYTDPIGARILQPINYDKITILKDNTITSNYHFAASFKFEALRRMSLSDTLIDGDIFLHKKLVYDILRDSKEDVIVSFFENKEYIDTFKDRNKRMFDMLKDKDLLFPPEDYDNIDGWFNTSVIHFNDEDFKKKYIDQYVENIKRLENTEYEDIWPDLVIEQRNLFRLSEQEHKEIKVLVDDYSSQWSQRYSVLIGLLHVGSAKIDYQPVVIKNLMEVNKPLVRKIEKYIPIIKKRLEEERKKL